MRQGKSVQCGSNALCSLFLAILCCLSFSIACSSNDSSQSAPGQEEIPDYDKLIAIPSFAWERPLGIHPGAIYENWGAIFYATAPRNDKRGIPLGGMGTGNLMYNLAGSFGPWDFDSGYHEERFLSQAAFHLFTREDGEPPSIVTLATEDMLPAWRKLEKGLGTYYALYPRGWIVHKGLKVELAVKFFSPIMAWNAKETSYPVAVFQMIVRNPGPQKQDVSLLFTFPNAPYSLHVPRRGLYNEVRMIPEDGITGILLGARDPDNPPETRGSAWCIATQSRPGLDVTYTTSWNGNGNGEDIYAAFSEDGTLPGQALDESDSAAALAVKTELAPGAFVVIPFVLSWDFPIEQFGGIPFIVPIPGIGDRWYRRYTEYWGTGGGHGLAIAREAILRAGEWEDMIKKWQSWILEEPAFPAWLKQGALNELYYNTFGGVFWENGCISRPKQYGNLPGQHLYYCLESQAYPMAESFDVRHYECRHYAVLWPEIERSVLTVWAEFIRDDPIGLCAHDAGSPALAPFFLFPLHPWSVTLRWKDTPCRYIQQVYQYYHYTKDRSFLEYCWPACKKTYEFLKTTDKDGNRIPDNEGADQTYDLWELKGTSSLVGTLWIGALEAMREIAGILDDPIQEEVEEWLALARSNLDTALWVEVPGYYKKDTGSRDRELLMADGLCGERMARTSGLPHVLPVERMVCHLKNLYRFNVAPFRDVDGDGYGDVGAANGAYPDGRIPSHIYPRGVWTGVSYFTAAIMFDLAKETGDQELQDMALKLAYGVYYTSWLDDTVAYWFNTPESWEARDPGICRSLQYQRARGIWELLLTIKDPFLPPL